MIPSGTVVRGPHTRIHFERTSADTEGALLRFEETYQVGPQRPPMHLHAVQTERFTVLRGTLGVRVGGETRTLGPGDVAEVPPGTPHTLWNAGDQVCVHRVEMMPALAMEDFFHAIVTLEAEGGVPPKSLAQAGRIAALFLRHGNQLAGVPWPFQRALLGTLVSISRWPARILAFPPVRIVLAAFLVVAPVTVTMALIRLALPAPLRVAWPHLLAAALSVGGYCLYVRRVEKRPVSELSRPRALREVGAGVLLGAALVTTTLGIVAALGSYRVTGSNPWTVLFAPLAELVLVAFLEELLFRGVLFRIVERSWGSWVGIVLSALLFAVAHLGNGGVSVLAFAGTALAGVLLAATYLVTRRLWLGVGLHFAWNYTLDAVFSVTVSGHPAKGLLQGTLSGPEWLSGGAYGVEASVVALVVIAGASVGLLGVARRRGHVVRAFSQRSAEGRAALEAATVGR